MHRLVVILITVSLLLCACGQATPPAVTYPDAPTAPVSTDATEPAAPPFPLWIRPEHSPAPSEAGFEPVEPSPVEALLQTMTPEEKVGQLFLARCPDIRAVEDIQTYHLGGYILFGRDFQGQTPQSMAATIAQYQAAAAIPMLIAVDEEGGTVTRVSSYKAFRSGRFPSPRNLYNQGGLSLLLQTEAEKCQLLRSLGIQVNMAPVCDITTDSRAFMYSRSLGLSPADTATAFAAMDPKFPVSLSLPAHRYLRQKMGFDGVIVTDDLVMGAITKQYGAEEAAVLAVLAGNDLLCSSEYAIQFRAVLVAVQSGRIPQAILDAAVCRVLQWKHTLGLL